MFCCWVPWDHVKFWHVRGDAKGQLDPLWLKGIYIKYYILNFQALNDVKYISQNSLCFSWKILTTVTMCRVAGVRPQAGEEHECGRGAGLQAAGADPAPAQAEEGAELRLLSAAHARTQLRALLPHGHAVSGHPRRLHVLHSTGAQVRRHNTCSTRSQSRQPIRSLLYSNAKDVLNPFFLSFKGLLVNQKY